MKPYEGCTLDLTYERVLEPKRDNIIKALERKFPGVKVQALVSDRPESTSITGAGIPHGHPIDHAAQVDQFGNVIKKLGGQTMLGMAQDELNRILSS